MVSTYVDGYRVQFAADPSASGSVDSLDRYTLPAGVVSSYTSGVVEYSTYEFGPPRRRVKLSQALHHLRPAVAQLAALPWGPGHRTEFPVEKPVVDRVARFLGQFDKDIPCPVVVQTSEGGVQLEWYGPEAEVELEFQPDGAVILLVEQNGAVSSVEIGPIIDLNRVREALGVPALPGRGEQHRG